MKKKELRELRKKKAEELRKEVGELRKRLALLKIDLVMGKVKNIREARLIKKSIAQMETIIKESEA